VGGGAVGRGQAGSPGSDGASPYLRRAFPREPATYFLVQTQEAIHPRRFPPPQLTTDNRQLATDPLPLPRRVEFKVGPGFNLAVLWIESFNANLFKDRFSLDLLS
jgi:hypothetical protein